MEKSTPEQEEKIKSYMEQYGISKKYAKRFIKMEDYAQTTPAKTVVFGSSGNFNIWPFLFGPFWYFYHGMWKKGLVLLVFIFLLLYVLDFITLQIFNKQGFFDKFLSGIVCSTFANYDYYCFKVRKQTGWGFLGYQFFK